MNFETCNTFDPFFSAAKVFNEMPVSVSSLTKFIAFRRCENVLFGDGSDVS